MKEIRDIISSYYNWQQEGRKMALATVVSVQGSSYRRPGARMLISDLGQITGAISGGCLEGDARRKALNVINKGTPSIVTYDTTDEDDAFLGVGLGCNGIIDVLIEPINPSLTDNSITQLEAAIKADKAFVAMTPVPIRNAASSLSVKDITTLTYVKDEVRSIEKVDFLSHAKLNNVVDQVLYQRSNDWLEIDGHDHIEKIFFQYISYTPHLVIVGAGNDILPLLSYCQILGWRTTVIDGRKNYLSEDRLGSTCQIIHAKAEDVLGQISIHEHTFFLLMTHNYVYDRILMSYLLTSDAPYIGMLGPHRKKYRMLEELKDAGVKWTDEQLSRLYSPVGLDIGAETPEEIALSIMAEIQAFMQKKNASSLKSKKGAIHSNIKMSI